VQAGGRGAAFGVGVSEVEPAGPVVGQDPPRLAENLAEGVHVGGRGGLVPVLARHPVVTLAPVGRAGDDAVSRLVWEGGEHAEGVTQVQCGSGVAPERGSSHRGSGGRVARRRAVRVRVVVARGFMALVLSFGVWLRWAVLLVVIGLVPSVRGYAE
jgi:hypothetical protein